MSRHKKHSDMQLYNVLADCMELTEVCLRDPQEYAVMDDLIKKLPVIEGKNRHYVERGSDIYQRVCRFVFHGEENTANTNRYAHCLREAARQGVMARTLIEELSKGGVNKFYLKRPSQDREVDVSTKCLRLSKTITHARSAPIVLTLKRNDEGFYDVIDEQAGKS